jgi:hypothetical protein
MNLRTNRSRALVIAATVAGTLLTGVTAAQAGTKAQVPEVSLTPATGTWTTDFKLSGGNCATDGHGGHVVVAMSREDGPSGDLVEADANAAGNWTITIDVPHAAGPGSYRLFPRCEPTAQWGTTAGFDYASRSLVLVPESTDEAPPAQPTPTTKPTAPRTTAPKAVRTNPRFTG